MIALQDTCRQIQEWMQATWQKLPVSKSFGEPIPLAVNAVGSVRRIPVTQAVFGHLSDPGLLKLLANADVPVRLEARGGGGKTTALRWLAAKFAAAIGAGDRDLPLPIYIDLAQMAIEEANPSLDQLCANVLERRRPIDYRPFQDTDRPRLFLLDGTDLIRVPHARRALLDQALNHFRDRFVFAGRPDELIRAQLDEWPSSLTLSLGVLDRRQRQDWLKTRVPSSAYLRYMAIVETNEMVDSLLDSPLLFAMTASACLDEGVTEAFAVDRYPGQTGIFAGFVDYALRRALRDGRLSEAQMDLFYETTSLLERICLLSARRGWRDRVPVSELGRLASEAGIGPDPQSNKVRAAGAWQALALGGMESGLLAREGDYYVFLHQQFAEYFAGRALASEWSDAEDRRQFDNQFCSAVSQRDGDAIAVHALSTLSIERDGTRFFVDAFNRLSQVDSQDACQLFSRTGASLAANLITTVAGDLTQPTMSRLFAIQALGTTPSLRAMECLTSFTATNLGAPFSLDLARAAIATLGLLKLPAAQEHLLRLGRDPRADPAIRLAAILARREAPNNDAFKLAQTVAKDDTWDEDVRTDAVQVLELAKNSDAIEALQKLTQTIPRDTALAFNVQAALSRLSTESPSAVQDEREVRAQDVFSPTEQLLAAGIEHAADVARSAAREESAGSAGDTSAATAQVVAPLEEAGARASQRIAAFLSAPDVQKHRLAQKLLNACRHETGFWEALRLDLKFAKLPISLRATCARMAGFRYLPPLEPSVIDAPGPHSHQDEMPVLAKPQRSLTPEEIMSAFLQQAQQRQERISLSQAAKYAASIGQNWSRSTLAKTSVWKGYQELLSHGKLAHLKDRRRRSRHQGND